MHQFSQDDNKVEQVLIPKILTLTPIKKTARLCYRLYRTGTPLLLKSIPLHFTLLYCMELD